jgi:hypothetical protein
MDKALIWCVIVLLIPIILMYLYSLWQRLMEYMSRPLNYTGDCWGSRVKETRAVTNKTIIKKKVFSRKHPPCATFFSKIDGEERQVDGPYEEKWLTLTEKWNWKIRRRKNE